MVPTSRNRQNSRSAPASRREAVERAEAFQRARMGYPVPVATLSRIVGLSERGLRNAFYTVRGMSPKRCLVAARLEGVRFALRDASRRHTTVTSIAGEYGFHELGRFAATYKAAYGEAPSETLRGTSRKYAVE